jgi:SSS family solute:Na+ symporter
VINVFVIYTGIILAAVMSVAKVGGLRTLEASLPEAHPGLDLFAMGPALIAAWFLVMITTTHSTQAVIQIGFAAKDEHHAARAYMLGGLIILPVGFVSAIVGMAAAASHPGIVAAEALPRMVMDLPPLAAGIILAGLWAADVSTASALLLGSAALVSSDIIKRFFAPDLSAAKEQMLCRVTVAILSVITFGLALAVEGILKALLVGLTLTTAYTLVALMTMYCPRLCRRSSATWTLSTTMAALALWLIAPAEWRVLPHPIYLAWIVSIVTFLLVAVFDPRKIDV